MDQRELERKVIGCIFRVHQTLGPGFLESVYRRATVVELRSQGLRVEAEKEVSILYRDQLVGTHKLDLLIEDCLNVELKTVEQLTKIYYSQLRSYLKATNLPVGLLVNYASSKADIRRVQPQTPDAQ